MQFIDFCLIVLLAAIVIVAPIAHRKEIRDEIISACAEVKDANSIRWKGQDRATKDIRAVLDAGSEGLQGR